jgi:hypothetical protein
MALGLGFWLLTRGLVCFPVSWIFVMIDDRCISYQLMGASVDLTLD